MVAELIVVPYLRGREGVGMGAGPAALEEGAVEILQPARVVRVDLGSPFTNEVGACFDLNRQVAHAVAGARERGALPVVLTGNCHTQQAVVAGSGVDDLGLVWLDCHADFNTPETTESGFFDGCALAMTVGDCWSGLCASVPGFSPLPADRVALVGARDLEAAERLPAAGRVSLHVDLDVLDPAYGMANRYAVAPGLSPDAVVAAVRTVLASRRLAGAHALRIRPGVRPDRQRPRRGARGAAPDRFVASC